jgi:peptidoglycan/xylan/chitin deacetylase (PgdA/CDA1 family)
MALSRIAWSAAFLVTLATPGLAHARSVAITFDDAPLAAEGSAVEAERVNHSILRALAKHRVPAIAFVNEKRVSGIGTEAGRRILREWLDRGHDLGNHTASHFDLSKTAFEQFRDDVIAGEESIAALLHERGRRPHFLRFPFNHTGDTRQKQDSVATFLAGRGYSIAACTIDNSDYEFARAYDGMLRRRDGVQVRRLRAAYLEYTAAEIEYYTRLHVQVLGHDIPHVMLFHVNRLNSDLMDRLLQLFEDRGYRFVTLDRAQSDAAYQTPAEFVTEFGPMWGYRWARERQVAVDGRLEPEPPRWVLESGAAQK